jgi:hypothetical protein
MLKHLGISLIRRNLTLSWDISELEKGILDYRKNYPEAFAKAPNETLVTDLIKHLNNNKKEIIC